MKKIIFGMISILFITFAFAEGTWKDHGHYSGSYCPSCAYNKGKVEGHEDAAKGRKYDDSCDIKDWSNYGKPTYETNKNKISDCQDGYDSGYGEKEWCEKCKANYPKGTHVCNKK